MFRLQLSPSVVRRRPVTRRQDTAAIEESLQVMLNEGVQRLDAAWPNAHEYGKSQDLAEEIEKQLADVRRIGEQTSTVYNSA
jgi:hypothetical protein